MQQSLRDPIALKANERNDCRCAEQLLESAVIVATSTALCPLFSLLVTSGRDSVRATGIKLPLRVSLFPYSECNETCTSSSPRFRFETTTVYNMIKPAFDSLGTPQANKTTTSIGICRCLVICTVTTSASSPAFVILVVKTL